MLSTTDLSKEKVLRIKGQLLIFRTIFQPWTILADILAALEGSFTKHIFLIFELGITLLGSRFKRST